MLVITRLKITGMTCSHCVLHTTKALEGVEGVENVDVELENGSATIEGDVETEKLISAIREAGYQASLY